ncbi:MAG: hypothetical protein K2Q21_12485 [Chitinophagaceae bacterium]|nr:hypothetical protein [Chitinophagaceae bacterium]
MQIVKTIIGLSICFFCVIKMQAQKEAAGKFIRTHSSFAPFPDTARSRGHDYNGQHFATKNHYDDSSVLIYVPKKFNLKKTLELVVWFHGWNNNIDSANAFFRLTEQFELSGRNALFIFPEGPKNAPDSYGGKLERPEMFILLINDLLKQLETAKIIPAKKHLLVKDCSISLAGHSGAYRVISKIIEHNKIDEIILFDAMYGGNDAYLHWIAESDAHRFLHIYTKDGGTFENTHLIMNQLKDSLKLNSISVNEGEITPALLESNNRIFIFSNKEHNEVITNNNNWQRFLKYRKK